MTIRDMSPDRNRYVGIYSTESGFFVSWLGFLTLFIVSTQMKKKIRSEDLSRYIVIKTETLSILETEFVSRNIDIVLLSVFVI